jgi:hypothetical protein
MGSDHDVLPMNHIEATRVTVLAARRDGACIPDALAAGMLGVARAWDQAEDEGSITVVSGLARRMLDYLKQLQSLVPIKAPEDAFTAIARELEGRSCPVKNPGNAAG